MTRARGRVQPRRGAARLPCRGAPRWASCTCLDALPRARLQVAAAAALFATGGAAIKAVGLSAPAVAGARSGLAALCLALLVPAARSALLRAPLRRLAPTALAYAATMLLFVGANKHTTAAAAVFLQDLAPLWVALLAPRLLGERLRGRDGPLLLVALAGLALVVLGPAGVGMTAPRPGLGNGMALAAGVTWALTLVGMRRLGGGAEALAAVLLGNLLTALAGLAVLPEYLQATPADWLALLWLGVIQVGLAYVLLTRGMSRIGAFDAALLVLVEPALSPLLAWAVHGEAPGWAVLGGGALILLAVTGRGWVPPRI